ncbi:hypothetical protein FQN51_009449 [Onygenales sp. PD_10]|nr:hypothetical protein FQN51_009449 [Onygenales sp. PD_10]
MAADTSIPGSDPIIPTYNAGFIVLSYLVSFAGCATSLELLHRRTSRFGLHNWYLLITSAVTMGGIGIWCMHFIGNCAIVLTTNNHASRISYSTRFTALSFFLPSVVLVIAFYVIGISELAKLWHIAVAGVLTGSAVCGMHYMGELGIANYSVSYHKANVVGAAVIAISASITALAVFFRLRASWSNSWWKRLISASILALAVSGMHWTATVGTTYRLKNAQSRPNAGLSSAHTVIICTTLACASCIFLIVLAGITTKRRKRSAHRVRQLVLACAYFDPSGRVMVSTEGELPTKKITDHYIERTFADDEFSKTHPAFIWAFRASRDWAALEKLIPGMKSHLESDTSTKRYLPGNGAPLDQGAELEVDFEFIFKELFCIAAQELADQLHQPLEKMGVLYEDIIATGTQSSSSFKRVKGHGQDPENATFSQIFGKGQFVFAVRQLNKQEAIHLSTKGFRFATAPQIHTMLARSMQVCPDTILARLEKMREYSSTERMMEPGVHLACFSLHPSIRKGFGVLVLEDSPNLLPHIQLPIEYVAQWQLDILSQMDEWTLASCLRWLAGSGGYTEPNAQLFCHEIYHAMTKLANLIQDPLFAQARFSARRVMVPCKSAPGSSVSSQCTVFVLHIIKALGSQGTAARLTHTPLRLFTAQQQVYRGVPDREAFQRALAHEFAHCVEPYKHKSASFSSTSSIYKFPSTPASYPPRSFSRNGSMGVAISTLKSHHRSKNSLSLRENLSAPSSSPPPPVSPQMPTFGGIKVSNHVTVDVTEYGKNPNGAYRGGSENRNGGENSGGNGTNGVNPFIGVEMRNLQMGITVEAGYGVSGEGAGFVEELCALCRKETG